MTDRKKFEAETRAQELFESLLTPREREEWDFHGRISINGHVLWKVASRSGNCGTCFYLPQSVPIYDDLVFKLLALRAGVLYELVNRAYQYRVLWEPPIFVP